MKFLLGLISVVSTLIVYYSGYSERPSVSPGKPAPVVRFTKGGAKFIRNPDETAVPPEPDPLPFGVVRLIPKPAPPSGGLGMDDLKARQKAEAQGLVTQRHGSGSLPQRQDVPRMDGMRIDY